MRTSKNKKKKINASLGVTLSAVLLASPFGATTALANESTAPNSSEPRTVDIEVENHWFGTQADTLDVILLANGEEVERASLNQEGEDWNYVFENVPQVRDGEVVDYSVAVSDLENHRTHVSGTIQSGFDIVHLEDPESPTFDGTSTDIPVEKNWIGEVGENAEIVLFIEGLEVDRVVLDEDTDWEYTFGDMPIVENEQGDPVTYSVQELNADGYDTLIHGNQIEGFAVSNIASDNAVIEGGVVARYVDEDGREIAYRTNLSGVVGADYKVAPKEIAGYELVETIGEEEGVFDLGVSEVVYQYELADDEAYVEGRIVTKYVNEDGVEIALREHHSGEIGSDYTIDPKEINGYTLNGVVGDNSGQFTDGVSEVVFEYVEDVDEEAPIMGSVVTKYVDRDGYEIAERERTSGEIGTAYDTELKQIDGYGFVEVRGDEEGEYAQGITIVEYVYDYVEDSLEDESEEVQLLRDTFAMYNEYKEAGLLQLKGASDVPTPDNMDEFLYNVEKLGYEGSIFFLRSGTLGSSASRELSEIYSFLRGLADELDVVIEDSNEDEIPTDENGNEDENVDEETPVDDEENNDDSTPVGEEENNEDENVEDETPTNNEDENTNETNEDENNDGETPINNEDDDNINDQINNPNDFDIEDVNLDESFNLESAFDKLTFGMTYDEVVDVMGVEGVSQTEGDISIGEEVIANSSVYTWIKPNGDGIGVGFIDDKAISKSMLIDGDTQVEYASGSDLNDIIGDDLDETVSNEDEDVTTNNQDNENVDEDTPGVIIETTADEKEEGIELPDTATNTFNLMAIGAGLLSIAGVGFFVINRRRNATDSE